MKFLTSMLLLLCLGLLPLVEDCAWANEDASSPTRIRVQYFPPAIYDDEVATWVIHSPAAQSLSVTLDDKPLSKANQPIQLKAGPNEINLALPPGKLLTFTTKQSTRLFQLSRPDGNAPVMSGALGLRGEKGLPVILQLPHKHPPKEDRRWQLWNWVSGHWQDNRDSVKSIQSVCAISATQDALAEQGIKPLSPVSTGTHDALGYYQLNLLVAQLVSLKEKTTLSKEMAYVLPLSLDDLNTGMTALQFRMQVEWVLARLRSLGAHYIFVPSIVRTVDQVKRYPKLNKTLRQASLSHHAIFVPLPQDGVATPLAANEHAKSVLDGIESIVNQESTP